MASMLVVICFMCFASVTLSGSGKFGLFDVNILSTDDCPGMKNASITIQVKPWKYNRTAMMCDVNFTNSIPFDDSISWKFVVQMETSRGVYKDNAYEKEIPKACSATKFYSPDLFNMFDRQLRKATGEHGCPIKPGSRIIKNIHLRLRPGNFPGPLNARFINKNYMVRNGKVLGCFMYKGETVPRMIYG